jgi:hypothetical protein
MARPHFLSPLLTRDAGAHGLRIVGSGRWLATNVEAAFDSRTRTRGLLGRDGLAPGACLVIAPCQGVHTFGMAFPIDVVAVSRDGRVAKCRPAVPRRRLVVALSAFAVVELAAGAISRTGLVVGDRLEVVPTEVSTGPRPDGAPDGV